MPWLTPSLEDLRALNRDNVQAQLRSGPMIPNSVMRVMADSNAGLAYLTLLYINWLALQIMPDTAETQFLDRFAEIWRPGGIARKTATFASGVINVTGIAGIPVPAGTLLSAVLVGGSSATFQTVLPIIMGVTATPVSVIALTPGQTSLSVGSTMSFSSGIAGIDGSATFVSILDGVAEETDDELRARVLDRIRQPPMGGDANDYVQWALAVPGVTRAWAAPNELGIGTVTVRFMMDDVRATTDPTTNGFPNPSDVLNVMNVLQNLRPVAVKDFFVLAPLPQVINFTVSGLSVDTVATRAAITASVTAMLVEKAMPASSLNGVLLPAQTVYAAWVSDAVLSAAGVDHFDLVMADQVMAGNGYMAVMGTVSYT